MSPTSTSSSGTPQTPRHSRRAPSLRLKRCGGPCGKELPASSFDIRRKSKDGLFPICKVCRRATRGPRGKEAQEALRAERQIGEMLASCGFTSPSVANVLSRTITELRQIGASGAAEAEYVRAVRKAVEVGGCRTSAEVVEDTRLSRWVVERILKQLVAEDVLERRAGYVLEADADEPGRDATEYHPASYPRGEDFTRLLHRPPDDGLL